MPVFNGQLGTIALGHGICLGGRGGNAGRDVTARSWADPCGISVIGQAQDRLAAIALRRDLRSGVGLLTFRHQMVQGALRILVTLPTPPLLAMLIASEGVDKKPYNTG